MQDRFVQGLSPAGFHRIHYLDWGRADANRVVVCVHGLARNARDFDDLAEALAKDRRLVCPDVVGRGLSDWLRDPSHYGYSQYLADMAALLARIGAERVDWVGTSMGGLIGMMLAAMPGTPIRRLVMNDVGPFIPATALERLAGYVGADPSFDDPAALEQYLREIYQPFGALTDDKWRRMATHSTRKKPDGTLGLAYDPAIGAPFREQPLADVDLWAIYDAVQCPVLVLRGESSDLLSAETADAMRDRGPRATVVEVPGCGHAPSLTTDDQIAGIGHWLDA